MTFPGKYLKLQQKESTSEVIKTVHRCISSGKPVYRWQDTQTSFADPGDFIFSKGCETISFETEELTFTEGQAKHLLSIRPGRVALLWDKSFLWGYMAISTLRDLGFNLDLITGAAVRNGGLEGYQLLVVPGGWASLKSEELGEAGRRELRRFVEGGGGYLGLCGGAGLALQVDEGLGLLPVARKRLTDRLPNFNGSIEIKRKNGHPLWWGLQAETAFQVWWPSQFELLQPQKIKVLGRYGEPKSDFWVSDLNVRATEAAGLEWGSLEKVYQINLDPERLLNEPAVLEGAYGQGRVLLSYPHLETPGDTQGNLALFNIWYDLLADEPLSERDGKHEMSSLYEPIQVGDKSLENLQRMADEAEEIVALGEACDLWSWRNPWLLNWKRGIRGSEYGSMLVLLRGLLEELEQTDATIHVLAKSSFREMHKQPEQLQSLWSTFLNKSRLLVEAEGRSLLCRNAVTDMEVSPEVSILRTEIFNCVHCYGSRSYDGLYREILDRIDTLLFGALLASQAS